MLMVAKANEAIMSCNQAVIVSVAVMLKLVHLLPLPILDHLHQPISLTLYVCTSETVVVSSEAARGYLSMCQCDRVFNSLVGSLFAI